MEEIKEYSKPNVYPNITFMRFIVEDQDGNQQMCVMISSAVRLRDDLNKGTIVSMSVSHDVDADIEDTLPIEMILSEEFHKNVKKVYEGGIEALNPDTPTFNVDDPEL
jgi:hypothetical protein